MKISLITICYNSKNSIKNTIESVEAQTFNELEHIIIDGGSTDGTLGVIKKHKSIDKIISEPDNGIYDAFNKGLKIAVGDIIGVLNSDDTFYNENSLRVINDAFDDKTDCVFGDLIYTNNNNKIKRVWKGSPFQKGAFKKGWMPAHQTFYCRKDIYKKYGLFDESYRIAGDFELMLRFLEKHNIRSKYISQTLVNMKTGGISNRSVKGKIDILTEEFRAFNQNNISVNKLCYILHKARKIKEFNFLNLI